jgi:tetratricopeptide (TPR) repeat protein
VWCGAAGCFLAALGVLGYWYFGPARQATPPAGEAELHWRQAQAAYESGDLAACQAHLGRCLEDWPLHAGAHFLLARTCRRLDNLPEWETQAHWAGLLGWPKEELDFEGRLARAQSGELAQTEALLQNQLDARPADEFLIVEALVKGYLEMHRLHDALHWCTQWQERYPNDPSPWYYRGRAFVESQAPVRAIEDFSHALELKPDFADARRRMASLLMSLGRFQEALGHYEACSASQPDNLDVLLGLASCQFSLGRMADARATLERLIARQPDYPAGLLLQAKLTLGENRPAEALALLRRADLLAPNRTDILTTLTLACRQEHREDEARQYEQKLSRLHEQVRRLEELGGRIRDDPANPALRHEAGTICLALGQEPEAMRWFKSVLRLDPKYQPTHKLLADYWQKHGDPVRAEHHRRLAGAGS